MFISKKNEESNLIISKKTPQTYNENKNIKLSRGIKDDELDEVCRFIKEQNKMSSGNTTLLPKNELEKYIRFNARTVLLRGGKNNTLLGTILSIPIPIKCNQKEIIQHGCTTFLNVHEKIRGHGMCMALIKELITYGHEEGIYCDYHTVPKKIGENSFQLSMWYRPLNLKKSVDLGFLFSGYDNSRNKRKTRLKYSTRMPVGYKIKQVTNENIKESLDYYRTLIKNKKFVFYPDVDLWTQWIKEFPTYLISNDSNYTGIFSYTSLYCKINKSNMKGKLALPLLCNGEMPSTLKCLTHIVEKDYDVLYSYCMGDVTRNVLKDINAIETKSNIWFSLYNNNISLDSKDISVPLI